MRDLFKSNFLLLAVIISACVPMIAQRTVLGSSIRLTITAPLEVKLGDPLTLHVVMTNISQEEVVVEKSVGAAHGEHYYSVILSSPSNDHPALTAYGESIKKKEFLPLSRIHTTLMPQQTLEEDVTLGKLYKMDKKGTYSVQVERADPNNPKIIVKSNVITVRIS